MELIDGLSRWLWANYDALDEGEETGGTSRMDLVNQFIQTDVYKQSTQGVDRSVWVRALLIRIVKYIYKDSSLKDSGFVDASTGDILIKEKAARLPLEEAPPFPKKLLQDILRELTMEKRVRSSADRATATSQGEGSSQGQGSKRKAEEEEGDMSKPIKKRMLTKESKLKKQQSTPLFIPSKATSQHIFSRVLNVERSVEELRDLHVKVNMTHQSTIVKLQRDMELVHKELIRLNQYLSQANK